MASETVTLLEIQSALHLASRLVRQRRSDLVGGEQVTWLENVRVKLDDSIQILEQIGVNNADTDSDKGGRCGMESCGADCAGACAESVGIQAGRAKER